MRAALAAALVAPALAACAALAPDDAERLPNVVIVFVDDMGWGDLGANGAVDIATPHLDRVAAEGVRLTDFYAAQPVCSASRAALLTGCYPNRVGIHRALHPNSKVGLHDEETTIAELLRARGYATATFGKWHLGHQPRFLPPNHGFDEYSGIPYSNDMWPRHPETPRNWPELPLLEGDRTLAYIHEQSWMTGYFTDRAVDFVDRNRDRPFFVYLAHPMPHVPLFTSEEFAGSSVQGAYGDVIQEIDAGVGRILRKLDELGIADDTLVVFTSDNGPWLSYGDHAGTTGRLREGKGTTFEGGVRVPFVARFPGRIPAGSVCSEPAMTIDLLPTIARLVGAPLPARPIDGIDVWPLLSGEPGAESPHEVLYFYYHVNHLEALRAGRWKLHVPHGYRTMRGREPGSGGTPGKYDYSARIGLELFDLATDVGETTDVSAEHPEVMERLLTLVEAARADLGDALTERVGGGVREPGRVD